MEKYVLELSNGIIVSPTLSQVSVSSKNDVIKNDMKNGYVWYSLASVYLKDTEISISFCFLNNNLMSFRIGLINKEKYGGSSWSDFSEVKEKQRAKDTEKWLNESGIKKECTWGRFSFGYDAKSASGAAVVYIIDAL